jgi:hypothetical protein
VISDSRKGTRLTARLFLDARRTMSDEEWVAFGAATDAEWATTWAETSGST